MDERSFERVLACHCAPALLGVKASCLISLDAGAYPDLEGLAGVYNARLDGPRFVVLGHREGRKLLLVYRPGLLRQALADPLAAGLLKRAGYPVGAPLPWMLRRLMDRLEGERFPHEIGIFLGYPPRDVESFLRDPEGCKLCGVWKVYHDVEGARKTFQLYDRCRSWMLRRLDRGTTLEELFRRRAA